MKKYCIKLISLIGILLSVIGYYYKSVPVFADGLRGLDIENGYEIRFERRDVWPDGCSICGIIENNGEKEIDNWYLDVCFDGEITGLWGAEIINKNENRYILKNAGYNQDIDGNSYVEFGFITSDSQALPYDVKMVQTLSEIDNSSATICIEVYNGDGPIISGNIIVENNSNRKIEDWVIEINNEIQFIEFYNAKLLENNNSKYVLKNNGYNSSIEPNNCIRIGFIAYVTDNQRHIDTTIVEKEEYAIYDVTIEEQIFLQKSESEESFTVFQEDVINFDISYQGRDNAMYVSNNLILPKRTIHGFEIEWESDNSDVVDSDGIVNRINNLELIDVHLTARIKNDFNYYEREFDIKVAPLPNGKEYKFLETDVFQNENLLLEYDNKGYINNLYGDIEDSMVNTVEDAFDIINGLSDVFKIDDCQNEIMFDRYSSNGKTHEFYFNQYYNGIEVYDSSVSVLSHIDNGVVFYVHSSYKNNIDIDTTPRISVKEVKSLLMNEYTDDSYEEPYLIIYNDEKYTNILSWCVELKSGGALYIDAQTGKLLSENHWESDYINNIKIPIKYVDVIGGQDENAVNVILTEKLNGECVVKDLLRGIRILDGTSNTESEYIALNKSELKNNDKYRQALYALDNVTKVYDFFRTRYKSVINRGILDVVINHQYYEPLTDTYKDVKNSYSLYSTKKNQTDKMYFGTELGVSMATYMDIVSHEYTHGITRSKLGRFASNNQTGAVCEAYSDIFAELILNSDSWVFGIDGSDTYRNIANPNELKSPSEYLGIFYEEVDSLADVTNDYGNVHKNSMVVSHAAYLMKEYGIPNDVLADIWYYSYAYYNNSKHFNFLDCRNAVVYGAMEYGDDNYTDIVKKAFDDVNIKETQNIVFVLKDVDSGDYIQNLNITVSYIDKAFCNHDSDRCKCDSARTTMLCDPELCYIGYNKENVNVQKKQCCSRIVRKNLSTDENGMVFLNHMKEGYYRIHAAYGHNNDVNILVKIDSNNATVKISQQIFRMDLFSGHMYEIDGISGICYKTAGADSSEISVYDIFVDGNRTVDIAGNVSFFDGDDEWENNEFKLKDSIIKLTKIDTDKSNEDCSEAVSNIRYFFGDNEGNYCGYNILPGLYQYHVYCYDYSISCDGMVFIDNESECYKFNPQVERTTSTQTVKGMVSKINGDPIGYAKVLYIRKNGTPYQKEMYTDKNGFYAMDVLAGNYSVVVEKEGFDLVTEDEIQIRKGTYNFDYLLSENKNKGNLQISFSTEQLLNMEVYQAKITVLGKDSENIFYSESFKSGDVICSLDEGVYTIHLEVTGFETYIGEVIVYGDKKVNYNFNLTENKYTIYFDTISYLSGGAEHNVDVKINSINRVEKYYCNLNDEDCNYISVPLGKYDICFYKEGYEQKNILVEVNIDGVYYEGRQHTIDEHVKVLLMPDVDSNQYMHGYIWRGVAPTIDYPFQCWYERDYTRFYQFIVYNFEDRVGEVVKNEYGGSVIFFSITLEEDEFDKIYPDLPNTMGVVKSYIGKSLQMQKGKNI